MGCILAIWPQGYTIIQLPTLHYSFFKQLTNNFSFPFETFELNYEYCPVLLRFVLHSSQLTFAEFKLRGVQALTFQNMILSYGLGVMFSKVKGLETVFHHLSSLLWDFEHNPVDLFTFSNEARVSQMNEEYSFQPILGSQLYGTWRMVLLVK